MIRAVIVDDEMAGIHNLQTMLKEYAPEVNIVAAEGNPERAADIIKKNSPDLVFMDVEMPIASGFDVLAQLGDMRFEVVFVTAYEKYALRAIKLSACDYILKPIDISELEAAVRKAVQRITAKESDRGISRLLENVRSLDKDRKIALPTMQGMIFVKIGDVVHCEADGSYTWFHFANRSKLLATKNLGEYEDILGTRDFIRVHRAHLVNKNHITEVAKGNAPTLVLSNGASICVSQRRRDALHEYLSSLSS